jgi:hypothetical protein
MPRKRQPHRNMTADGTRAVNTDPHGIDILSGKSVRAVSFYKPGLPRNRPGGERCHDEKG